MTWTSTVSIDAPADVTARITSVLDAIDPWYSLDRLPEHTVVRWAPSDEMFNATSWRAAVQINSRVFTVDGGWEQSLAHELAHVVDKQLLTDADRARVMALVSGCLSSVGGVCVQPLAPVWGLDLSVPYGQRCGELFAETVSRHIWYALVQHTAGADLPAYGAYTFDPAVILPVMLDVLAGPKPLVVTPKADTPPQPEDPAMLVKSWIYGEGADLLAAMSAARATGAAVVTNRAEAAALIKAGATITVIGGPACTSLGLTWATTGRKEQGSVTACNGATYADSLALAMAA